MTVRLRHQLLRALAVTMLVPSLMGNQCSATGAEPDEKTISFDFDTLNVESGKPQVVGIQVNSTSEFHAFEIDIESEGGPIGIHSAVPAEPFDDNGILFAEPVYAIFAGTIKNIIDFRHGNVSATGPIRIAEFTLYPNNPTPQTFLAFSRVKIIDANGVELNIMPVTSIFEIKP